VETKPILSTSDTLKSKGLMKKEGCIELADDLLVFYPKAFALIENRLYILNFEEKDKITSEIQKELFLEKVVSIYSFFKNIYIKTEESEYFFIPKKIIEDKNIENIKKTCLFEFPISGISDKNRMNEAIMSTPILESPIIDWFVSKSNEKEVLSENSSHLKFCHFSIENKNFNISKEENRFIKEISNVL